jgi:hypothetical protein
MGQRTFRSQLADSISKEFYNQDQSRTENTKSKAGNPVTSTINEKLIDVDIDFCLEDPLRKLKDNSFRIKNGIINSLTSGNSRINRLKLNILTSLSNRQTYSNLNLQVVFGVFFNKDINFIEVKILSNYKNISQINSDVTISTNSTNKKYYNELIDNRNIMNKIIDSMVFKSKVNVVLNNKFIYHILPGFKNHSIVLSYKNSNESFDSKEDFSIVEHHFVETLLNDFIHHSYSEIATDFASFQNMKLSINKQISKSVNNIILPTLVIKDIENYNTGVFKTFFKFLVSRFKFVSIKIRLEEGNYNENQEFDEYNSKYLQENDLQENKDPCQVDSFENKQRKIFELISRMLGDLKSEINNFEYAILIIEINLNEVKKNLNYNISNNDLISTNKNNDEKISVNMIKGLFKTIINENNFQKLALVYHESSTIQNSKTFLHDELNKFHYVYYNRKLSQSLVSNLKFLKSIEYLKTVQKKKPVLILYLEFLYGKNFRSKFFVDGVVDFSTEIIPNTKIHLN